MVRAAEQSKRTLCIALFNRQLHANNICPANHEVAYDCGWFYMDGKNVGHRPELTAEADEIMRSGRYVVLYWEEGNTFVLGDVNDD